MRRARGSVADARAPLARSRGWYVRGPSRVSRRNRDTPPIAPIGAAPRAGAGEPQPSTRETTTASPALPRTILGRTGLEITRIGFGAWAIGGGGWEFGWARRRTRQSIAAIHHALEAGVNWIDTAAAYGFGRSEKVVGRALAGLAERPYVFTKCSLVEGPDRQVRNSLERDSSLREAHGSLERLGLGHVQTFDQF